MTTTTNGKYEMTARKSADGIDSVMTEYHRTRKSAEESAHRAREFGWATWIKRV